MICPNCGREAREDARFCDRCGVVLDAKLADVSAIRRQPGGRAEPAPQRPARKKVLTCVLPGCVIVALLLVWLFVDTMPALMRARVKARSTSCLSNVKQLELAALMYDRDWGQLPDGARWCDELMPYTRNPHLFVCPDDGGGPSDYAINSAVAGVGADTIGQPDAVVCIFDSTNGWNQQGGPSLVVNRHYKRTEGFVDMVVNRHKIGANVGFVDGHVKWVQASAVDDLTWTPTITSPAPTTGGP